MDTLTVSAPVLTNLASVLGTDRVIAPGESLARALENTSHFVPPSVLGWVKPRNTDELAQVLAVCTAHKTPVFTFSMGLNWGMGSKLPVVDGCLLLELSGLNRILEIDEKQRFAIVEPGVSQGELSAELEKRGLRVVLNVTGSAPQASVLGNALERGSGFLEHRYNDIRGMEVMLADGSLIRSGFWNLAPSDRDLQHFPMGFGPDWRGLFSQSNLGIVTKMVVQLYPKKEVQKMIWCKVAQDQLPKLVEAIGDLYQRKYLFSVTHIGNDKRMKIEHQNKEAGTTWTAMAMVQGSEAFVQFLEKEIPRYLSGFCLSMGFMTEEDAAGAGLAEVYGCHVGKPTDYFLRAMYRSADADLNPEQWQIDHGRYGMLCCLPVLSSRSDDIREAVRILESIEKDFGLIPAATLNPMNDLSLESVINLYFDRQDPDAVKLAHEANEEMIRRFYQSGFRFYRFDVKVAREYIDGANPHWQLVSRLKEALDPAGILSPGRYQAL